MIPNLLLSLWLCTLPAAAGDFFISTTDEQKPSGPDIGGMNWIRVFNNFEDGGWWIAFHWEHEGVPGYNVAPLSTDLYMDMSARRRLAVAQPRADGASAGSSERGRR